MFLQHKATPLSREGSVCLWAGAIGARQGAAAAAAKKKTIEGKLVVVVVVMKMKLVAWLKVGIGRERWRRTT